MLASVTMCKDDIRDPNRKNNIIWWFGLSYTCSLIQSVTFLEQVVFTCCLAAVMCLLARICNSYSCQYETFCGIDQQCHCHYTIKFIRWQHTAMDEGRDYFLSSLLLQPGCPYALSVLSSDRVHHITIQLTVDNKYYIGQYSFESIAQIIAYYSHSALCYTSDGQEVLLGSQFVHSDAATSFPLAQWYLRQ